MSSIPNGRYQAQAIDAFMGDSYNGKPVLEVMWEILEGEHAGARVSSLSYFTGGAKQITLDMMKHIGLQGSDLDTMRGRASISLYDDTYKGETTQKVRVFVPRADGTQTPEARRKSPAAAKALLESMMGNGSGDAFDAPDMPGDDAAPGTTDSDGLPF